MSDNNNTIRVYRHEYKYLLPYTEYEQLRRLLGTFMERDTYAGEGGDYYIRSLYFDTPDNADYYDKIKGVPKRKKLRLRIYDTAADTAKLEIKNKDGDYSMKETTLISRRDAELLSGGKYGVLSEYGSSVARKAQILFESCAYAPKVLVDYEREAYYFPMENVRLTFDKNVRAKKANWGKGLYSDKNDFVSVKKSDSMILEVKYDGFLPLCIRNALSSINMQRMSISKYCLAREIVM